MQALAGAPTDGDDDARRLSDVEHLVASKIEAAEKARMALEGDESAAGAALTEVRVQCMCSYTTCLQIDTITTVSRYACQPS